MTSPASEPTGLARIPRPLRLSVALAYAAALVVWTGAWMFAIGTPPGGRLGVEWDGEPSGEGLELVEVVAGTAAETAGLRAGDRLMVIDGYSLRDTTLPLLAALYRGPGSEVLLEYERAGSVRSIRLRLGEAAPPSRQLGGLDRALTLVMNLYPFWFVAVGLVVLFQRLEDAHAWLLAFMFGAFAVSAPYFMLEASLPGWLRGFGAAMVIGLSWQAPALFYAFFSTFPARSVLDRRLPWLKWAFSVSIAALTLPLALRALAAGSPAPIWDALGRMSHPPILVWLIAYQFTAFLLGLATLLLNALRAADPETRRKARVMLWGTAAGLGPIIALNGIAMLLGEPPPVATGYPGSALPFWMWGLSIVALLLWPLSFAYAVVKHRVLEIPWLLRRGARYLLVQRGFLLLVALASLGASGLLVRVFTEVGARRGGMAAPMGAAAGIALGLGLAFTGSRIHRRVAQRVDRAFFREAYDARLLLEQLTEQTRDVESREELADLLDRSLRQALRPARSDVFLAGGSERLEHYGAEPLPSLDPEALFPGGSGGRLGPLIGPDAGLGPLGPLSPECVVPLPGRKGDLLGLVVLGPRLSEEPYSREDRALLAAVASQAGLTLEGIALGEQIADRIEAERRAAREMEIAREVQRKLLPQQSLRTAKLDYAARCVQARAVGGDYWDTLRLDEERLALVLADISGKGISAALLMAHLQASLRSRPPAAFQDLRALLSALNGQLCESTEPSRYATLFLSTWDDARRRLRYVCCGHGPPLLLRAGGSVERLAPTASVIGLFEDWDGEVAETPLDPGDWLVLYTDGVTEGLDPSGEEFGEQRLIEAVAASRQTSPEAALESVFAKLDAWCAGAEQWDDQTLLLARAE